MGAAFISQRPSSVMSSFPRDAAIDTLNALPSQDLTSYLFLCCGSREWTRRMDALRPFASRQHLQACADWCWWTCPEDEWRSSFLHHPRIGGDIGALRKKFAATPSSSSPSSCSIPLHAGRDDSPYPPRSNPAWEGEEQSGAAGAAERTLEALSAGNQAYEDRFGHVFLICATGKSADVMLAALQARIGNEPQVELLNAVGEQAKITNLRLSKLLDQGLMAGASRSNATGPSSRL